MDGEELAAWVALMTHDSCIFIGRACLKESNESVGRKSESGRESGRCKEEEGGREERGGV